MRLEADAGWTQITGNPDLRVFIEHRHITAAMLLGAQCGPSLMWYSRTEPREQLHNFFIPTTH